MSRPALSLPLAATVASLLLLATYLALGGAGFRPSPVADPCRERPWGSVQGAASTAERMALSALDGAACDLHVSRETLALALRSRSALSQFQEEHDVTAADLADAARKGLVRAVDDANEAGVLNRLEAFVLRETVQRLPLDQLVEALRSGLAG